MRTIQQLRAAGYSRGQPHRLSAAKDREGRKLHSHCASGTRGDLCAAIRSRIVYGQPYPAYVGPALTFGVGFAVGSWLNYDCDWPRRRVCVGDWNHDGNTTGTGNAAPGDYAVNVVNIHRDTARDSGSLVGRSSVTRGKASDPNPSMLRTRPILKRRSIRRVPRLKGLREAPKSLQRHIPSRPNRNLQAALARKVEEASPARKGTRARVESPLGERSSLLAYQVTADIGLVKSHINFAACFASSARGLNRGQCIGKGSGLEYCTFPVPRTHCRGYPAGSVTATMSAQTGVRVQTHSFLFLFDISPILTCGLNRIVVLTLEKQHVF